MTTRADRAGEREKALAEARDKLREGRVGFLESLTTEQLKAALAYTGDDTIGDTTDTRFTRRGKIQ